MGFKKFLSLSTIVLSSSICVASICNLVYRDYKLANNLQLIKYDNLSRELYKSGSYGESIDLQKKNPEAWNKILSNHYEFHSLTNNPNFRNTLSLREHRDLNNDGLFPNLGVIGGTLGTMLGYSLLRKDKEKPKS